MSNALKQSLLELVRVVVLAIIPVLMTGIDVETGRIAIDVQVLVAVGLLAALRFADKLVHSLGKEYGSYQLTKGITRF